MPQGDSFAFGPFQSRRPSATALEDGQPIALSARQIALPSALVSHGRRGDLKDQPDPGRVARRRRSPITASNRRSRRCGGRSARPDPREYITTEARRGYRFSAPVTRLVSRETDASLDALLAPHRAWIEGRAALESLERDRIVHARDVFEDVLQRVPDQAPVHVGLANACCFAIRDDPRRRGARSPCARTGGGSRARSLPPRRELRRSVGDARLRAGSCRPARRRPLPPPGARSRWNPTTGGITSASPTPRGAKSVCAPPIAR